MLSQVSQPPYDLTPDPPKTPEDVIDFGNAAPCVTAGVNSEGLPRFPGILGSMPPEQRDCRPAGEQEPHHGKACSCPLLIGPYNNGERYARTNLLWFA